MLNLPKPPCPSSPSEKLLIRLIPDPSDIIESIEILRLSGVKGVLEFIDDDVAVVVAAMKVVCSSTSLSSL